VLVAGAILAGALAPVASAALPSVSTAVVTTPLANFGSHRGVTVSAGCAAGSRLVGGGGYLRRVADPAALPTNGLVLGGTSPSTGSSPVDLAAPDGTVDPATWFSIANYTGVSEADNQASTFALCATSDGPAHTIVKTASRTGLLATQEVQPPNLATATCPAGSRLIGGGATTSTPDQVNDGVTVGNNGNLKPMGDYPSDSAGVAAADGSTSATSWSAYGSSGISAATDTVTAYALCSTDPATPPVQVARVDVDGPDAQAGTTITTASATCPSGMRMLGGGYGVDETVAGTGSGLQPQQGYHMRGSYPSTPGTPPAAVADGAANPDTWTALVQAGGQNLAAGKHMTTRAYALCATAPAAAPPAAQTGDPSAITASTAGVSGTVTPNGASTTYVFEYGTSLSFGSITTPAGAGSGASGVPVTQTLSGLAAGTTYYYRLVASSSAGTAVGAVRSFTTVGATAPVVTTKPATDVADSSATLTGEVNPKGQATAFTFEYGTTTGFGAITTPVQLDSAGAVEPVTATATGLAPNTTYYYRVVATNASGTSVGFVMSFTTGPGALPTVTTGVTSAIAATGATLSGTVNPGGRQTTFAFEYGTTNTFGSISAVDNAGASGATQGVALSIGGLSPGTTYVYRLVATNALGTTAGALRSFTTPAA
jgi:hypothetical protein